MTYIELDSLFIEAKEKGFITGSLNEPNFSCNDKCDICPAGDACEYLASKGAPNQDADDLHGNFLRNREDMLEWLRNDKTLGGL